MCCVYTNEMLLNETSVSEYRARAPTYVTNIIDRAKRKDSVESERRLSFSIKLMNFLLPWKLYVGNGNG